MALSANILVIDDDESIRIGCMQALTGEGYRVKAVENGDRGLALTRKESFDIVLLDLKMPGIPGMEVLRILRESDPNTEVIVITGFATIDSAVSAMKQGAFDYLPKPFTTESLCSVVKKAVTCRRQALEDACMFLSLAEKEVSDALIGRSDAMKKSVMLINKVAPTDSTVLITGETGVGKELVARTIHRLSTRREQPFITVDCGVLVESLFESELFGHVKGSYTGALETTRGTFELASGGTIFLDEIANISYKMQSRLLRVIQEQEISKIGSSEKIKLDVRIIAATNRDLLREIEEGKFREDLFYRFNVFPIHIPPLRERRDDILPLAQYFIRTCDVRGRKSQPTVSPEVMRFLEMYDWPGNVRELKNTVERAVVTCERNVISVDDLSLPARNHPRTHPEKNEGALTELEKREIIKVLKQFNGHKTKTAEYLGINRKTLREKIRKYDIET